MREPTQEQFLKDVAKHRMEVAHESDLYRHLRFKSSECGFNQWFDLVTWPGYLTICGDMGTWTFARVRDMLTFFRSGKLEINASYWAEKLQGGASGGRSAAKVFDQDKFAERLLDQLENYYSLEGDDLERVRTAVREEVLSRHDGDGQHALINAAYEFECLLHEADHSDLCRNTRYGSSGCICSAKNEVFRFSEPTEIPDGMEYSFHFIWCLYAIVWGIQQYDSLPKEVAA